MHMGTSFLGLTYDPKILNHGKCSKISNTSLSVLKKMLDRYSQNACQNSKQGSSLIRVCTVCQGLFGSRLVFNILEHLL